MIWRNTWLVLDNSVTLCVSYFIILYTLFAEFGFIFGVYSLKNYRINLYCLLC
jgi:hypothetical protein